jgi:hypothetical protein
MAAAMKRQMACKNRACEGGGENKKGAEAPLMCCAKNSALFATRFVAHAIRALASIRVR